MLCLTQQIYDSFIYDSNLIQSDLFDIYISNPLLINKQYLFIVGEFNSTYYEFLLIIDSLPNWYIIKQCL